MAVKVNSLRAWVLAARPKTLSGAVIPVLLGSSLAYADGHLHLVSALLCALFACFMQVAANFVNDLYDFLKGSDRSDRLGPERACAQGWITTRAMKAGIAVAIALSAVVGMTVFFMERGALPYEGYELVLMGVCCMAFCFLYTTLLSYKGWGDVLVLLFFGIVPVCGTYYVQAHVLTAAAFVLSLVCGLATDTLLVVNNYRDREQDRISGKRTLVVRFGEPFGRYFYLFLGVAAVMLASLLILFRELSLWGFLVPATVYLLLHVSTWRKMCRIREGKALNGILGENSRNMLVLGVLLSLGIIVSSVG